MTDYLIRIVAQGEDRASAPLGAVGGALGRMGEIAGGIIGAQLIQNIAAGILDMGRAALDSYASYESLGMALQTMVAREMVNTGQSKNLASALDAAGGKAQALQAWITQLAIKSPFKQDDISQGFKLAMAFGFTADESKRLTTALVNFAAGTGSTGEVLNRISAALGKVKAQGKLTGEAVMQLSEAGLSVDLILAKAFKKTTAEIVDMRGKGLIPADKAIEAITKSLETDFGGAAERTAGTFSGLISSLDDIKSVGLREFFTGTFKAIQPYLSSFVDMFSSPEFMASLREIGAQLGGAIKTGLEFISGIVPKIRQAFTDISGVLPKVKEFFTGLVTPDIQHSFLELLGTFSLFQTDFEDAVPQFKQLAANLWQTLADAFQNILPGLQKNFGSIVHNISEFLGRIAVFFEEHGTEIMGIISVVWNLITTTIGGALTIVGGLLDSFFQIIVGVWDLLTAVLKGDWAGAWAVIQKTAAGVWATLKTTLKTFINNVLKIVGTDLKGMEKVWGDIWRNLQKIARNVWDDIVTTVNSWIAAAGKWFSGIDLSKIGASILNSLTNGALSQWNAGVATVNGWIDAARKWFSGIDLYAIGSSILTTLKNGLSSIWTTVSSTVGGWVSQAWTWFQGTDLYQIGRNIIQTLLTGLALVWQDTYNAVLGPDGWIAQAGRWFRGVDLYQIGRNIIQGLWNGLVDLWESVKKWVEQNFGWMKNIADAVFGNSSPSKVMYKTGVNFMKGLANGLNASANLPADAIERISAGLTGSFTGGLGLSSGTQTIQKNYNLNLSTYTSPAVVQSSFEILKVLEYGS